MQKKKFFSASGTARTFEGHGWTRSCHVSSSAAAHRRLSPMQHGSSINSHQALLSYAASYSFPYAWPSKALERACPISSPAYLSLPLNLFSVCFSSPSISFALWFLGKEFASNIANMFSLYVQSSTRICIYTSENLYAMQGRSEFLWMQIWSILFSISWSSDTFIAQYFFMCKTKASPLIR